MYTCLICMKHFKSHYNLKNHENNSKLHKKRVNETLHYFCKCGQSFSHRQSLHKHKQFCKHICNEQLNDNNIEQELRDKMILIEKENEELRQKMNDIELAPLSTVQYRMKRNVNKKTRNEVYSNQTGLCGMCERKLPPYFQVDHVVALQFGGNNEIDNLMALCCDCHAKKSFTENECRVQIRETVSKILEQYT